jgi:hypothetical protein
MADSRLRSVVLEGERLRYSGSLRGGGVVGLTEERLLVVRESESDPTSVELRNVDSVDFQDFDYFVGVLSALLVAFGAVTALSNLLGGVAFGAAGLASLYLGYRKRDRAMVRTHSRPKPLALYPEDAGEFYDAFGDALERVREREAESETGPPEGTTG